MKNKRKQELRLKQRRRNTTTPTGPKTGFRMPGSMNQHKSTSIKEIRKEK